MLTIPDVEVFGVAYESLLVGLFVAVALGGAVVVALAIRAGDGTADDDAPVSRGGLLLSTIGLAVALLFARVFTLIPQKASDTPGLGVATVLAAAVFFFSYLRPFIRKAMRRARRVGVTRWIALPLGVLPAIPLVVLVLIVPPARASRPTAQV